MGRLLRPEGGGGRGGRSQRIGGYRGVADDEQLITGKGGCYGLRWGI